MKRLWVCAALLVFAVGVCVCARIGLSRVAQGEIRLLQSAQEIVREENAAAADRAITACEQYWEENSLPFYLFVDHNFFNQYEYTLFHLRDYAAQEPGLALQQLGYCAAVLQDLAESQKPVLENIF